MTENGPHQGTQGTIVMIVPFFLFFFLFYDYLLGFYRKTAHDQAHDDRERSPPRYTGHNHYDRPSFSFFFFFFSITYSIFTGKPPTIGLAMMWKRPHKGTPGTIIMIVPFFFYFFIFLNTDFFFLFTGELPVIGLAMAGIGPHRGTPGTIHNDRALNFFFFPNTYCLFTVKPPMAGLAMTRNRPHKGTPGTIIMIVPFFLHFFYFIF